jgi:hypothetical protein
MKGISMASERQRLVELALESLRRKKEDIDAEIEQLQRLLKGSRSAGVTQKKSSAKGKTSSLTRSERERRSRRTKEYWKNWRERNKGHQ